MTPEIFGSLVSAGIPTVFGLLLIIAGFNSRNNVNTVEENPSAGSGWLSGLGFALVAFGVIQFFIGLV